MSTLRNSVIRLAYVVDPVLRGPLLGVLREAARPIRIDRAAVDRVLDDIYAVLGGLARDNPKEPAGTHREEVATGTLTVTDVRGQPKWVMVLVTIKESPGSALVLGGGFGHVRGGPLKGSPVIVLELNGIYHWETLADPQVSRERLRSVLMHEVTHAMDVERKKGGPGYLKKKLSPGEIATSDDVDAVAYYNDPMEVRAFMRELYEEIAPGVRKIMSTKLRAEWGLGGVITRVLRLKDSWTQMEKHLTRANRNRILKGLFTAFEDEGL